jgi:transposase
MEPREMRFAPPRAPREQLILYARTLDEVVPGDDPVRTLAALLEEVDWRPWEDAYVGCGQPPIHPRYLAGAILLGLLNKLGSTRELERAACKHLDFMWLLEGFEPDHSTFAAFRKRHARNIEDLNRFVARRLVAMREKEKGLLQLVIDGTRLRADSDRHGGRTAEFIEAVLNELNRRLEELAPEPEAPPAQIDAFADPEPLAPPEPKDPAGARLQAKQRKYEKALAVAHERNARAQQHDGPKAKPVRVPITDPECQITPNKEGGFAPNYTPVAAVEPQTGAIVYSDVLTGSEESAAVLPAVAAAQALMGQTPQAVVADTNFAAAEVLEGLDREAIDAYMPTRSMSPPDNPAQRPDPTVPVAEPDRGRLPKQADKLARTAFVYNDADDVYYCPMGHTLPLHRKGLNSRGILCSYYQCEHCPDCPLAPQCLKGKTRYRTLTRDPYEPLREAAARRMATQAGQEIYRGRSPAIETVFALLKGGMGIRRFHLRGLTNVKTEWHWICTAYNLKKLLHRLTAPTTKEGGHPKQPSIDLAGTLNRALHHLTRFSRLFIRIGKTRQLCNLVPLPQAA